VNSPAEVSVEPRVLPRHLAVVDPPIAIPQKIRHKYLPLVANAINAAYYGPASCFPPNSLTDAPTQEMAFS